MTGGLAGAIVVEGPLDEVPGIAGLPEHVLMIQASQFDADGQMVPVADQTTTSVTRFVNGQLNPVIRMRPGEVQRWRIANIQANDFMELSLDGHQLHQIAADANPFDEVVAQDSIVMAPANRVEVLVEAGQPGRTPCGRLVRRQRGGGAGDARRGRRARRGRAAADRAVAVRGPPRRCCRRDRGRSRSPTRTDRLGSHRRQAFDPDRVDQTIKLGALEEWTIRNDSDDLAPVPHPHQRLPGRRDRRGAVRGPQPAGHGAPPAQRLGDDSASASPTSPGKSVYHCHILNHEDLGMMAVFEVVPPPEPTRCVNAPPAPVREKITFVPAFYAPTPMIRDSPTGYQRISTRSPRRRAVRGVLVGRCCDRSCHPEGASHGHVSGQRSIEVVWPGERLGPDPSATSAEANSCHTVAVLLARPTHPRAPMTPIVTTTYADAHAALEQHASSTARPRRSCSMQGRRGA